MRCRTGAGDWDPTVERRRRRHPRQRIPSGDGQQEVQRVVGMMLRKDRRNTPSLTRLAYGTVYCELCRNAVGPGEPVAWWPVTGKGGRLRRTAYCAQCHSANIQHGHALR
jgi:hypothetical protein